MKVMLLVIVTVSLLSTTGFGSEGFPQGTYTAELVSADVPSSYPPQRAARTVGRYEMTFGEAGRHTVTWNGTMVVEGQYAATQNQIAVFKDKGPRGCDILENDPRLPAGTPAQAYSGVYTWTFDGKMLTLTRVADECGGRVVVFTAHPWAKRK